MTVTPAPPIVVAAAVVQRDGAYLVTRRLNGTHLAGCWEFPGGKCEPGESLTACLAREIVEELGCDIDIGEELLTVVHTYPERAVELHFFRGALRQEPRPLLGQDILWVPRADLRALAFPPADEALIRLLTA